MASGELLPQPDPQGLRRVNGTEDAVDSAGWGTALLSAHIGQPQLITSRASVGYVAPVSQG